MKLTSLAHGLQDKIEQLGIAHLFVHWETLSENEKKELQRDIESIDPNLYSKLRQHLQAPSHMELSDAPFIHKKPQILEDAPAQYAIASGRVGVILLAGGQASRLKTTLPKGCTPITTVKQKTLFEYFSQKVLAASKLYGRDLPVAIMTSRHTHEETVNYFKKNHFFGLSHLSFFQQEEYPLFDGHFFPFLETRSRVAFGPNGNGSIYYSFKKSGLLERWKASGIEHAHILSVDNPLADPFSTQILTTHLLSKAEVTLCADLALVSEKVGSVVQAKNGAMVKDYMEISAKSLEDQQRLGNLGIYVFSLPFMEKAAHLELPLHVVKKSVMQLFGEQTFRPETPNAWKLETFIFDAFCVASQVEVFVQSRDFCFAPLKSMENLEKVQNALIEKDRKTYFSLFGENSAQLQELDPTYYYLSESQRMVCKDSKERFRSAYFVEGI